MSLWFGPQWYFERLSLVGWANYLVASGDGAQISQYFLARRTNGKNEWSLEWYQAIGLKCLSGKSFSASTDCVTQSNVTRCCFNFRSCVTFWSSAKRQRSLNNQKEKSRKSVIFSFNCNHFCNHDKPVRQQPFLLIPYDVKSLTWCGRCLGRILSTVNTFIYFIYFLFYLPHTINYIINKHNKDSNK